MESAETTLVDLKEKRRKWLWQFKIWQFTSWGLLVGIGAGSAFVASSLSTNMGVKEHAALCVAVASALLAALRPEIRAQATRRAYVEIDGAIKREEGMSDELVEALRRSESYIEAGYYPTENPASKVISGPLNSN